MVRISAGLEAIMTITCLEVYLSLYSDETRLKIRLGDSSTGSSKGDSREGQAKRASV